MRTEQLNYFLPRELVAQRPTDSRADSRLLVFDRSGGCLTDTRFARIGEFLRPGDCLVLNDTKVIPARFFAYRTTGAEIEGLFLSEENAGVWQVLLKNARRIKPGQTVYLRDRHKRSFCAAEAVERLEHGAWLLKINHNASAETILSEIGFVPLPPYIKRDDDKEPAEMDRRRYQTVYARCPGAVAAPTAGLHFTSRLIEELKDDGVCFAYLTLHVGPATFKPITGQTLQQHKMHPEWFRLDESNAGIINRAKQKQGRIIAVGTTSVRTLETLAEDNQIKAGAGQTKLFIKPGHKFRVVDAMVTNFHLPKTTLLALVAAFAGLDNILAAYRHAIEQKYRFYSYGDAMLII